MSYWEGSPIIYRIAAGFIFALISAALMAVATGAEDFKYESRGRRDPFVSLVGPEKASTAILSDVTSIDEIELEGIAIGAEGRAVVIMNGEMLRENDKVGNLEIKKITKSEVHLLIGGKEYVLNLAQEGEPRLKR